ncbi:MAG: Ribosomal large subunit methyltransferase [Planctomycetota bacterium]
MSDEEDEVFGRSPQFRFESSRGFPQVVLRQRRAQPFFGRHPWVFAGAIELVRTGDAGRLEAGDPVQLVTHEGRFVAWGLFNPISRISVRLYSWQESQPLTAAYWYSLVESAVALRRRLFDLRKPTTGCRLIFSEADFLSGLTVDNYGGWLLVQFTSLALYRHREHLLAALNALFEPRGIWLRTEKGMRESEGLEVVDGLLSGPEPPQPVFIEEHGTTWGVDVQRGQKTGCYLDQRDNRLAASRYLSGAHVLDAFCFSGGFGITALKSGNAESVTGIDSSEAALTLARNNAVLNGVAERCGWIHEDVRTALDKLAAAGRLFDGVILDPPRMARSRGGLERALQGYIRLNEAGLRVLKPGGILVTCSCSGLVSRNDFAEVIAETARRSGRNIQILEHHGQPADHPVSATCPETEYLKVLICRVL